LSVADWAEGRCDLPSCYGSCDCSPKVFVRCPYAEDCSAEKNGYSDR